MYSKRAMPLRARLLALLLPLLWAPLCRAAQPQTPADVQLLDSFPGASRAVTSEDLADLLRDNLDQDLLPWQPSAARSGPLTALDFLNLLHQIDTQWQPYRRNFIAIVAIRNNQYSYWAYPTARSWCTRRVKIAGEEFTRYIRSHNISFPDVMYVMNGYDKPLCPRGTCSAPVFSYGKCWQPAMPSVACPPADITTPDSLSLTKRAAKRRPGGDAPSISALLSSTTDSDTDSNTDVAAQQRLLQQAAAAGNATHSGSADGTAHTDNVDRGIAHSVTQHSDSAISSEGHVLSHEAPPNSPHDDILLPVMNHPFDQLLQYPWDRQEPVAFMRAGLYAAMAPNCSRVQLYRLARTQAGKGVLDVGIYQNRHWRVKVDTVSAVPIEDHARYRFLINTDGQAASWRLAKLLAMGSVVLKWRSPHIEHYYRSLKPGEHYVDVDQSDLLAALDTLKQPEQEQRLKEMAANAQRFAYRFLSQLPRTAYASAALERYRDLYKPGDMDLLLSTLSDTGVPDMLRLLQLRQKLLAEH